jgi:hypothetical protein
MVSGGFEPAIPAIERPQIYALNRTATEIDRHTFTSLIMFGDEYKLQSR